MSVDGKFPTRDGVPTGSANERAMLDKVGYDSIRTELREGGDGMVTMLRTRGGHPEFTNSKTETTSETKQKCVGPYGFVDTNYDLGGIGDGSSGTIKYLIDETGAVRPPEKAKIGDTHAWKDLFHNNLPSNYSGLMRRIMQVEHAVVKMTERNAFSCTFAKSHGLYVNQTDGRRWLIEIDSTGIYRIPLKFCKDITTSWADYLAFEADTFATHTYEEAADIIASYWRVKKIRTLEKEQFGAAPACYAEGYEPWYPWCGWAFDYTGAKATIVLLRVHPVEASWNQSALFDLTISEAGGVPSYVTYSKSGESALASPSNDTNPAGVAAIQGPSAIPALLETKSIYSPISTGAIHAPLFSFYDAGGKSVYYFDRYVATTGTHTSTTNGNPETRHVSRIGSCLIGSIPNINPENLPHYDATGEDGYDVTLQTQMSGVYSDSESGAFSGGFGISGTFYPEDHNIDKNVTRQFDEVASGLSGWACSRSGAIVGVSTGMWSRLDYISTSLEAITDYQRFPVESFGGDYMVEPVTARVRISHPTHSETIAHDATAILSGYDRESFAIALTRYDSNSAYTKAASYDNAVMHLGGVLFARNNGADPGMWQPLMGADNWYHYALNSTGGYNVSKVEGCYDVNSLAGMVFGIGPIFDGPNGGFSGGANAIQTDPSMNYTESVPASSTQTRKLWVRVGGSNYETTPATLDFHHVYIGGYTFRFWCGAAAFKPRAFHSTDINLKPKVEGVGPYPLAQRSLFGFIGVF